MDMYSVCLTLVFIVLRSAALLPNEGCGEAEYRNGQQECVKCSGCPTGQGVSQPCTLADDTICSPCEDGITWSYSLNGNERKCVPCLACTHRKVIRECNSTSNAMCGSCLKGYKNSDLGQCIKVNEPDKEKGNGDFEGREQRSGKGEPYERQYSSALERLSLNSDQHFRILLCVGVVLLVTLILLIIVGIYGSLKIKTYLSPRYKLLNNGQVV